MWKWLFGPLLALVAIAVVVFVAAWIVEWLRRWKEDRWGFRTWMDSGAPHVFPALLEAFRGEVIRAGYLKIPSGAIIAADPVYLEEKGVPAEPFDERVPVGEWPVDAILADHQVAALRVRWDDAQIAFFEPAFTPASRKVALDKRTLPGIGVDSATCCLTSVEGRDAYLRNKSQGGGEGESDRVTEVKYDGGVNLFYCQSGKGDGSYSCYFAKTRDGRPVAMFIEFGELGDADRIRDRSSLGL